MAVRHGSTEFFMLVLRICTVAVVTLAASFSMVEGGFTKYRHDKGYRTERVEGVDAQTIVKQLTDKALNFDQLHTYDELVDELQRIEVETHGLVGVGPLIVNGSNGGHVDIDTPRINGMSLRDAVVNTVISDSVPTLGNMDSGKVGLSNMGRNLMAAKVGHGPTRVMYITQQHGNEFIETEAAFGFLRKLGNARDETSKRIRREISLLFIVRANPDGGEPDPSRCVMETPFPPPLAGDVDCAFYRFNIDATAGTEPTNDPFHGAVGVGYNLNRYHISKLNGPIRPVESQAIVAAVLAFRPHFIMDLHGDVPKVTCDIDESSISAVIPGVVFNSKCQSDEGLRVNNASVRATGELLGVIDPVARGWNALIAEAITKVGFSVGRHRHVHEISKIMHTVGDYSRIEVDGEPTHTMLLEVRNSSGVLDPFFSQVSPALKVNLVSNEVLGEKNFEIGIALSGIAMMEGLKSIANGAVDHISGDGGYAEIPVDTGLIFGPSDVAMGVLRLKDPGPYLFPL